MRLVMYRDRDRKQLGVLQGSRVLAVEELGDRHSQDFPADILSLIDAGQPALDRLGDLQTEAIESVVEKQEQQSKILLAPLDPPRGNVIAVGRNYLEHAKESAQARGEQVSPPTVFTKAQTSINGPFGDIPVDRNISEQVDWEVELGVVIGRTTKNVDPAEALEHVFGYTVLNDISARDIQYGWGGQFFKGKSLDGFCPTGPSIVTADEVPDPQVLRLTLRVNGEPKQAGTTGDMIYPVADLISWLSRGMTLLPGTLIATGTPAGVGHSRTPPEFLRPGDVVEAEVEGIGILVNRVVAS